MIQTIFNENNFDPIFEKKFNGENFGRSQKEIETFERIEQFKKTSGI